MKYSEDTFKQLFDTARRMNDKIRLGVLQEVKNEFMKVQKSRATHELSDAEEDAILVKMVKQYEEAIKDFEKNGRTDLVEKETAELAILKEYAPHIATDDEVRGLTEKVIGDYVADKGEGFALSMKDMKPILTIVQSTISTANGKIVSEILRKHM